MSFVEMTAHLSDGLVVLEAPGDFCAVVDACLLSALVGPDLDGVARPVLDDVGRVSAAGVLEDAFRLLGPLRDGRDGELDEGRSDVDLEALLGRDRHRELAVLPARLGASDLDRKGPLLEDVLPGAGEREGLVRARMAPAKEGDAGTHELVRL